MPRTSSAEKKVAIETQLALLQAGMGELNKKIDEVLERVTATNGNVGKHETRLAVIETKGAEHEERIKANETKVAGHDTVMQDISAKSKALNTVTNIVVAMAASGLIALVDWLKR